MNTIMIYLPIAMVLLLFMLSNDLVLKQDPGDGKMKEISDYIMKVL
jgi:K(+)-stimulated pyrophosphate-energized sodium pump